MSHIVNRDMVITWDGVEIPVRGRDRGARPARLTLWQAYGGKNSLRQFTEGAMTCPFTGSLRDTPALPGV